MRTSAPRNTIFDPTTESWTDVQPMAYPRWYPTLTKLPDGRMLAVSGAINCPDCGLPGGAHNGIADLPEIFNPATNTWSVTRASLRLPLYPHMYVSCPTGGCSPTTAEDPIASRVLNLRPARGALSIPSYVMAVLRDVPSRGRSSSPGPRSNPDYSNARLPVRRPGYRALRPSHHHLALVIHGVSATRISSRRSLTAPSSDRWLGELRRDRQGERGASGGSGTATETWRTYVRSGGRASLYHSQGDPFHQAADVARGGGGLQPGYEEFKNRGLLPAVSVQGATSDDHVRPGAGELRAEELLRRYTGRLDDQQGRPDPAARGHACQELQFRIHPVDVLADSGRSRHRSAQREHRAARQLHALPRQREWRAVRRVVGEGLRFRGSFSSLSFEAASKRPAPAAYTERQCDT